MNSDVETLLIYWKEMRKGTKSFRNTATKRVSQLVPRYWFIIGIPYSKTSNFYPRRQVKPKIIHVQVPS